MSTNYSYKINKGTFRRFAPKGSFIDLKKVAPGQSISRILSSRITPACVTISLGVPLPARSCSLPETYPPEGGRRRAASRFPRETSSLLGLAPGGGCLAAALLRSPVVSYTAISPLLSVHEETKAVRFCGPFQYLTTLRGLPGTAPGGVRTFLDAHVERRGHPTGLGQFHHTCKE